MPQEFCGLLNLNKPTGITSRDAVNCVQRLLPRRTKVGHAGTLDPLASGVLVLCIGRATRLIEHVQRRPKSYRGEFLLGRTSPSEDTDSTVTELPSPPTPSIGALKEAATRFVGRIEQRPPIFSALKVNGRRAYDLARAGEKVDLAPRLIDIYRLEVIDFTYPRLTLEVTCGSGTYIRSLGRDLAESLGTGAVMSALVRTAIGPFTLEDAIGPDALKQETLADQIQPALLAVDDLPRIELTESTHIEITHGRSILLPPDLPVAEQYVALTPDGKLAALLKIVQSRLTPTRVFCRNDD